MQFYLGSRKKVEETHLCIGGTEERMFVRIYVCRKKKNTKKIKMNNQVERKKKKKF